MAVVALTAVLLTLLGLACPTGAAAQTKEDTLVYALQSDIDNWDPPNSVLREAIILGYHVFDHLATRDVKTGRVGPSLATSWRAIDETTWEVKLRQGVKFHDGSPFSAKDVKATFERVLDPAKKMSARGNHAKIKSVEVLDDSTVRFKTDGPYPLFVERLTAQVMQSAKVMQDKGHDWMQENPVGTGPYKLVKWSRKQEHLLVRNDDYWGPKAHFKHVRIRIIPEQATQIAELISGGVDVIKAVPPDQMDEINKSGQARIVTSPILRTAYIKLDQPARNGKNPMEDRRVRQAANLAVDMDPIIKHVLNGLGDRTATAVNPMAFGFDPALQPYKQDIPRAKKLLARGMSCL
jgi:peptide/nickel transport system substrate-binding protein